MMTNNSGKFVSAPSVSNLETVMSVEEMSQHIPSAPGSLRQTIEEYFGRFWWVWVLLLIIILKTK